jgi:hypothetical protein
MGDTADNVGAHFASPDQTDAYGFSSVCSGGEVAGEAREGDIRGHDFLQGYAAGYCTFVFSVNISLCCGAAMNAAKQGLTHKINRT